MATRKRTIQKDQPKHKLTAAQKSEARLKRRNAHKSSNIKVVAAHKLSKAQKEHIQEIFGKSKSLQVEVKPEILGGIIIQTDDKLFDGSITTQLRRLKNHITQS